MALRLPNGVRRLLRLPFSAARARRDIDDEVNFHLEMRADSLRRRGVPPDDADRQALARFGDPEELHEYSRREGHRAARRRSIAESIDSLVRDIQFGLRQLRRAPGFAATAIVMCALGIGANTALFSIVHRLILDPLPFADGDRMVMLESTAGGGAFLVQPTQSMADTWMRGAHAVERILVVQDRAIVLGDTAADIPEKGYGVATVPGALAFVRARPELGRDLVADDTLADASAVAMISHGIWQRQFGGGSDVLGKRILVDGKSELIIGVLPPRFALPLINGAAGPIDILEPLRHSATVRPVAAIAKLPIGSTAADANRELASLFAAEQIDAQPSDIGSRRKISDAPFVTTGEDLIGKGYRQIVLMLFGAVAFVLIIACANVANLLLSRAWSRQREFAVRRALGAGRKRLVRQVLVESLTLGIAGGALGLAVAAGTLRIMVAVQPPRSSELNIVGLDSTVLLWTLGVSLMTGLLFGTGPALFASRADISSSLKSEGRTAAGSVGGGRLRATLVVLEIALSVTLLAGTGLLVRTLVAMRRYDVGFAPRGLVGTAIGLTSKRYDDFATRRSTLDALLERTRKLPGVEGAAFSLMLPPGNAASVARLQVEGIPQATTDSVKSIGLQSATPEYFRVAGIRLLQGRVFSPNSVLSDKLASDEVVVSVAFANRFWPGASALGKRIRLGMFGWSTIVGVVPNVQPPAAADRMRPMQVYEALPTAPRNPILIVRTSLPPIELSAALRLALRDIDPSLKLRRDGVTAEAEVAHFMSVHRFVLGVLGGFAVLALCLAAIGMYGVIAFGVGQRTREIGVRIALGARYADVIGMVLHDALRLSLVGIVLGGIGAVAATRALRGLLFGVQPGDPLTLVATAALLGLVAICAAYLPARRAAAVDPIQALRAD